MGSFKKCTKILLVFTALACLNVIKIAIAAGGVQAKKKAEKMVSEMRSHMDNHLSAYHNAHEQIFNAENSWRANYMQKKNEQVARINGALAEITKEMKYAKPIGLDQRDQVLAETGTLLKTASQQLATATAEEEAAQHRVAQARAVQEATLQEMQEVRQRLNAITEQFNSAKSALGMAEVERKRLQEELQREQKRDTKVQEQLIAIQMAQSMIQQYEDEYQNKKGHREALDPHMDTAVEQRKNLLQAIRKQLIIQELEELENALHMGKYQRGVVSAEAIRALADNRDKMMYLGAKYFGVGAQVANEKCPRVENTANILNRIKESFKKRGRADKTRPNEMLEIVGKGVCDYDQLVERLSHDEKQTLQDMLLEKDGAKSNIAKMGEKMDSQVEKQIRKLISPRVKEYPIDQLRQTDQQQQRQQATAIALEQGESSGVKNADDQPTLEEISQALITEQQQNESDRTSVGTDQEQNANAKQLDDKRAEESSSSNNNSGQLRRRKTFKEMLDVPHDQIKHDDGVEIKQEEGGSVDSDKSQDKDNNEEVIKEQQQSMAANGVGLIKNGSKSFRKQPSRKNDATPKA